MQTRIEHQQVYFRAALRINEKGYNAGVTSQLTDINIAKRYMFIRKTVRVPIELRLKHFMFFIKGVTM